MGTESRGSDSLPSFSEPLLSIGSPREIHEKQKNEGGSHRHATAINTLPDIVLLDIFDFCRKAQPRLPVVWKWHLLVHVCQRWRQIVFESPHRLNLQILCSFGTPVRKNLAIWPAFPIVIYYPSYSSKNGIPPDDEDDVIAALEHRDRLCSLNLCVTELQLEKITKVMREPFPMLTDLHIDSASGNSLVLPAEFLGGSAPRLQIMTLFSLLDPALPLLLSTSDLVFLDLCFVPLDGYISPEAMVAYLAALPRLELFSIGFEFPSDTSHNDRMPLPPVTRIALPALVDFSFAGTSEYLEDFVSRIDAPQLYCISIDYVLQLVTVDYQVAQLSKLIDRSAVIPKLTQFRRADVHFFSRTVTYVVYPHMNRPSSDWHAAEAFISFEGFDWHVLDIAQLLSLLPTVLSNVTHLNLAEFRANRRLEDMDDFDWLHFFRQFSTVQTLRVSQELAPRVAHALEDTVGELVAEVLPSLELIRIMGQPASSIEKFIAARRLSGCPVTAIDTDTEFNERLESCHSR
ncbi:hypothetical protein EDB89DRAFT_1069246 [Lactarius sanguifluus]|nr:hypothetical protein EDB89DRAFT_1069246 [Lactarius sanguifluus]